MYKRQEDETGKFNDSTYQSLIELTTWLMGRYDLSADDVIRHYDVTGKKCPLYFVEHEDAWEQFHKDLDTYIEENGVPKEDGTYKLEVCYHEKDQVTGSGWLDVVEISVYAGNGAEPLYTLESQKYRPGA